jgi:hypothetical protein
VKQATAMDLRIGSFNIPPGITTVLNGVLDLFLIPLFANVIYPLCGIKRREREREIFRLVLCSFEFVCGFLVVLRVYSILMMLF